MIFALKTKLCHPVRMCNQQYKIYLAILILITIYFIYAFNVSYINNIEAFHEEEMKLVLDVPYLVNSSRCKLLNIDPYNVEVVEFAKRKQYISCTTKPLLSYIEHNSTDAVLKINTTVISHYSRILPVSCCYSVVTRMPSRTDPDDNIKFSDCESFENEIVPKGDIIMVNCKTIFVNVYKNVHAIIRKTSKIQEKLDNFSATKKPMGVLFLGIDSISRLNFIRMMPKSRKYLKTNDWLEFQGYNKMCDNTFTNLMAAFTGFNESTSFKVCVPKTVGGLDKCPLVWYDFRKAGYITAYGEDEKLLNTFNYFRKGFNKPPTDYYFRPYVIASEELETIIVDSGSYCTGPETSGERIFNLAKDFTTTFKDDPFFGVFWSSTFSHNAVNTVSMMDGKLSDLFNSLELNGVLEKNMVIFISDHGFRWGKIRRTVTGWYEERLPFFYMWIPKWFREANPEVYKNLQVNMNRLTTPYDVFMTLQDVLLYAGSNHVLRASTGCPNCASLFKEVDEERNCKDANIEPHFCTCRNYFHVSPTCNSTLQAVNFVINVINNKLAKNNMTDKCENFQLGRVISSSGSDVEVESKGIDNYLLLAIETVPEANFEATVSVRKNGNINEFNLEGFISRLDIYGPTSGCVSEDRMYCYCK